MRGSLGLNFAVAGSLCLAAILMYIYWPRLLKEKISGRASGSVPLVSDDLTFTATVDEYNQLTGIRLGGKPLYTAGEVLDMCQTAYNMGSNRKPFFPWAKDKGLLS